VLILTVVHDTNRTNTIASPRARALMTAKQVISQLFFSRRC
jgi:hypothetical protein